MMNTLESATSSKILTPETKERESLRQKEDIDFLHLN